MPGFIREPIMYRPFYTPIRLRRVELYGRRKAEVYLAVVTVVLLLVVYLVMFRSPGTRFSDKRNAPVRKHMQPCTKHFGSVTIFLAKQHDSKSKYDSAEASLECYVKGTDYNLLVVDLEKDPIVNAKCSNHQSALFKRHCAAAAYLHISDWMLVVDEETGVINPQHCIEEWIDNRVDILLYERFFNWEITVSSYLVRNSDFSRKFLFDLARWEFEPVPKWTSYDQGALMLHLLQTVNPRAVWEIDACTDYWFNANSYQTYMAAVMCVRQALGAQRIWPGKVRIYRKMHGWSRDIWISQNSWNEHDFMLHGWKKDVTDSQHLFTKKIKAENCDASLKEWDWKGQFLVSTDDLKKILEDSEDYYRTEFPNKGRLIAYFDFPDIGRCYPNCENSKRSKNVGVKALRVKR